MRRKKIGASHELKAGYYPFHYGDEAEQYTFYRVPKLLFDDPRLRELSTDAKLLYGLMLDRMSLSAKNGWYDEDGRVFIYFSVEQIMAQLGCGNSKCSRLLAELDDQSGVGLITRIRQGQGKPDFIYVHKCIGEMSKSHFKRCQNDISKNAEMKRQEISKAHANNTEKNYNDLSENNPFFSEGECEAMQGMSEREKYRLMIEENIGYAYLVSEYRRDGLDEIVELMVDTVCTTQDYIVIGGDRKPAEVVRSQLLKLDSEHIRFVLDGMSENTSRVRNIRKYLLAALYNAAMTIDNYYAALVNHDLYGK